MSINVIYTKSVRHVRRPKYVLNVASMHVHCVVAARCAMRRKAVIMTQQCTDRCLR